MGWPAKVNVRTPLKLSFNRSHDGGETLCCKRTDQASSFHYLKEHRHRGTPFIDQAAAALSGFEVATGYKDLKKFHGE